jgi:hypothetical protein
MEATAAGKLGVGIFGSDGRSKAGFEMRPDEGPTVVAIGRDGKVRFATP